MNELVKRYASHGLQVIGLPCNQFGYQENLGDAEILNVLKYVRPGNGFVPAFPLMAKMDANGAKADILWQWIRQSLPYPSDTPTGPFIVGQVDVFWAPVSRTDLGWNFEKFLMDRNGRPYKRWSEAIHTLDPDIIHAIETLLLVNRSVTLSH